ncbi:lipopolysaccharide kinase InaA family protein [Planctomycetota bacterium]
MAELPFKLLIKNTSTGKRHEKVNCTELLRSINGRRDVYDALWDRRGVIVKVFGDKIRAKRHQQREWRGLWLLKDKGLSSPEPLFTGQTEDGRRALVMEKIDDSSTVLDVLKKTTKKSRQLDLLVMVCRELARQHNKGVFQRDLHLGNFLLKEDMVFALDAGQMRFLRRTLQRRKGICQLALLMHPFLKDEQSKRRICEEYMCARGWDLKPSDEKLFSKQLPASKKRGVRRGLRKFLRTNKRHLRFNQNRCNGIVERDFCDGHGLIEFISKVDLLMDESLILKNGNTCYVSHLCWNNKDVVVKRFNYKGLLHSIRHTIKGSRAKKGWINGHRLRMLDIPTPKPLTFFEKRKGKILWKSYLVTEYVAGQNLHTFLRDNNVTEQQRSIIIGQVEELLETLGSHRITHGDLKHTNILITSNGPVLTDLDGMKVHKCPWVYKVKHSKDISRLMNRGRSGSTS